MDLQNDLQRIERQEQALVVQVLAQMCGVDPRQLAMDSE